MFNKPMLGGLNVKAAGAYLLPPSLKSRKKKQKIKSEQPLEEEALDKQASTLADAIIFEKQAAFFSKIQSGDLGGGWNPYDQINPIQ